VLSDPSLAQILLARTLMVGNRPLAKDTINNVPAAPDHDLVFSPESISHTHTSVVDGRDFYGHRMFEGQQDNGCDVWIDMLATGWATPRDYMFLSAASSRDETHGRRLFDELVHRGLLPDWDIVHIALVFGQSGFVNLLLDKCIEASGDIPRDAVRRLWMTAVHRDDVWLLKIFSQRGIGSVSTTAGPPRHGTSAPVAQRTPNAPGPLQTLLHEAAECGSPAVVEWLIDHGVANIRNAQGQTAYDSAKGMHGYYVENLHHNRNYPATVKGIEKALEVLEARGFGP
jgi:hypothetical protein